MKVATLGMLLLLSTTAVAQSTGTLLGRVVDSATGAPMAKVEVRLTALNRSVITDSTGTYRFTDVPAGVQDINVRLFGFKTITISSAVITGTESQSDFRLARTATLDTVTTTAPGTPAYRSPQLKQFEERRLASRGGAFISEEQMRKGEDRTLGNMLRRVSGLRISIYNSQEYAASSRSAGGAQAGALLGGRNARPSLGPRADPNRNDSPRGCWVSLYVDGNPLFMGDSTSPAPDLSKFPVRDLAGAEYYGGSGNLPAQYSTTRASTCGVLLLWTRER